MQINSDDDIGFVIRRLQGADEAQVCARWMANSEPWITLRRTYDESISMLNDPAREVYVGIVEDDIIAFLILRMDGAFIGYIQTVAVVPEWRGRGVGSRLIEYAEERIFRETPNVFISASSFNPGAQRLYKRLGYEVVGELKDYVVPGHSEVLMRKTIGPLVDFKLRIYCQIGGKERRQNSAASHPGMHQCQC
jgi:ribosomal-protein-alanine N-acetyltransferase